MVVWLAEIRGARNNEQSILVDKALAEGSGSDDLGGLDRQRGLLHAPDSRLQGVAQLLAQAAPQLDGEGARRFSAARHSVQVDIDQASRLRLHRQRPAGE